MCMYRCDDSRGVTLPGDGGSYLPGDAGSYLGDLGAPPPTPRGIREGDACPLFSIPRGGRLGEALANPD